MLKPGSGIIVADLGRGHIATLDLVAFLTALHQEVLSCRDEASTIEAATVRLSPALSPVPGRCGAGRRALTTEHGGAWPRRHWRKLWAMDKVVIQLRRNVSPVYRTQGTGNPYLDVFAAVVRRAIQDVAAGNGHAEDAAQFLREHDLARRVMQLAQKAGIEVGV